MGVCPMLLDETCFFLAAILTKRGHGCGKVPGRHATERPSVCQCKPAEATRETPS
jgi:hypothetical protein